MKVNLKRGKVQITLTDAEVSHELRELLGVMAWDRERSAMGWSLRNEALVEFYARLAGVVDGLKGEDGCMSVVHRDDAVKMGEDYTSAYEAMQKAVSAMNMNSRASFELKRRTKRERADVKARQKRVLLRALDPGIPLVEDSVDA